MTSIIKEDFTGANGVYHTYDSDDNEFISYGNASYCMDEEPLNDIAVNGKCFVYCKPDGYFKKRGYMSNIMENPTYGDLLKVANDLINSTEDFDHHFLESFDVNVINDEGLQQVDLCFGS